MPETIPTPNAMPGAAAPQETPKDEPKPVAEAKTPQAETPTGLSAEDKAELERLRGVHKDEQKFRREATQNFEDAERWRQLSKTVGGEPGFDPQAEFQRLRDEVTNERTERIRTEVARTENVPPKYITGATEEDMRASAQEYRADIDAAIEKALKGRAPAAAPASEVTANGKVAGPNQITSRDELKNMTHQEIVAARNDGRLDSLIGKT